MTTQPTIHILNGPNLNLLGTREPEVYGTTTLADIEANCRAHAKRLGMEIVFRQTNREGELVDQIQEAARAGAGLILNAGAYTHTSIAIMDALLACPKNIIEVHLSNPQSREPYRHRSWVARAARGSICGFGARGYLLALDALHGWLQQEEGKA